jgi:hypothetical protein
MPNSDISIDFSSPLRLEESCVLLGTIESLFGPHNTATIVPLGDWDNVDIDTTKSIKIHYNCQVKEGFEDSERTPGVAAFVIGDEVIIFHTPAIEIEGVITEEAITLIIAHARPNRTLFCKKEYLKISVYYAGFLAPSRTEFKGTITTMLDPFTGEILNPTALVESGLSTLDPTTLAQLGALQYPTTNTALSDIFEAEFLASTSVSTPNVLGSHTQLGYCDLVGDDGNVVWSFDNPVLWEGYQLADKTPLPYLEHLAPNLVWSPTYATYTSINNKGSNLWYSYIDGTWPVSPNAGMSWCVTVSEDMHLDTLTSAAHPPIGNSVFNFCIMSNTNIPDTIERTKYLATAFSEECHWRGDPWPAPNWAGDTEYLSGGSTESAICFGRYHAYGLGAISYLMSRSEYTWDCYDPNHNSSTVGGVILDHCALATASAYGDNVPDIDSLTIENAFKLHDAAISANIEVAAEAAFALIPDLYTVPEDMYRSGQYGHIISDVALSTYMIKSIFPEQ